MYPLSFTETAYGHIMESHQLTLIVCTSLAYAELYRTIASFVRRFDMELYETTVDNFRVGRDLGVGHPKEGQFSVRAKVTNVVKD